MKAITVWQPWATLIAIGAKEIETRSWATKHRGPVAIHAAKRPPFPAEQIDTGVIIASEIDAYYGSASPWDELPRGVVLCVCELVDCFQIDESHGQALDWRELAFGDFTPGRYGWKLRVIEVFKTPIPAKGAQGLWEWVA